MSFQSQITKITVIIAVFTQFDGCLIPFQINEEGAVGKDGRLVIGQRILEVSPACPACSKQSLNQTCVGRPEI